MRNFSWTYFTMTGDVDAFLLYREVDQLIRSEEAAPFGASPEAEPETEAGSADL